MTWAWRIPEIETRDRKIVLRGIFLLRRKALAYSCQDWSGLGKIEEMGSFVFCFPTKISVPVCGAENEPQPRGTTLIGIASERDKKEVLLSS